MRLAICLLMVIAIACTPKSSTNNKKAGSTASSSSSEMTSSDPFTDLSVDEFVEQAESDPNAIILDVRTPQETAEGMVPGAIEIDYRADNFSSEVSKLDKGKSYYIYCRSGGRSVGACEEMAKQGFPKLYNMLGGYNAYQEGK